MAERVRYRSFVADSARWDGFEFRDGDIVISTPPKCGTTWTQMICALLIFDTDTFDRPLAEISPWLDMQTNDLPSILGLLEQQEHRRFIKTHTPLDGLPFDERATYLCVGRDPRDVSRSWEHHLANMDFNAFINARMAAVGMDDVAELGPLPEPPPEDPVERFWLWADSPGGPMEGTTLAGILHHVDTFWERRDAPNIALFHYADLSADLPGQMERLAGVLGIDRSPERIAALAEAATFDRMKARADDLAPDVTNSIWLSNREFFHQGRSGQWRDLLDSDGLERYQRRVDELVPPDLARWVHAGWLASEGSPAFA